MAMKHISDSQIVQAFQDAWGRFNPDALELLERRTGQCSKVCVLAAERAVNRGLIEYGVSLRTAWVTESGRNLLEAAAGAA